MPPMRGCHGSPRGGNCHCHPPAKAERFFQPSLLLCLAEQPSYGYELLERLSLLPFNTGVPDPGTIYRHLRRLENDGYVESRWETGESGPAKRVYSITPNGIGLLHTWADELKERRAALDSFLQRYNKLSDTDR